MSGYPTRVAEVVEQIAAAPDEASVHHLLHRGAVALGAQRAAFVTFTRSEAGLTSFRWMLDCDPAWCRRYVENECFAHDPWLAHAARKSEPTLASALNVVDPVQRDVVALAAEGGFASAVLIPAHSGAALGRVSLLCLGHCEAGYFEAGGLARLRVAARALALELHEWWPTRLRHQLLARSRITDDDVTLLEHHCLGHSSKRIAAELGVTRISVNSRFQRLIAKLGVTNRRLAAELAIECGLIAS